MNTDWRDVTSRIMGARPRNVPHTAGHVVSALNDVSPEGREWTPQRLFLFISAFTKVERDSVPDQTLVTWLRPPSDIVTLLLRGTRPDDTQRGALEAMLTAECGEVFETLRLFAPYERSMDSRPPAKAGAVQENLKPEEDSSSPKAPGISLSTARGPLTATIALAGLAAPFAAGVATLARSSFDTKKRHMKDRMIVGLLADPLLGGGLSTLECRSVLLMQGIDVGDVDRVLRSTAQT